MARGAPAAAVDAPGSLSSVLRRPATSASCSLSGAPAAARRLTLAALLFLLLLLLRAVPAAGAGGRARGLSVPSGQCTGKRAACLLRKCKHTWLASSKRIAYVQCMIATSICIIARRHLHMLSTTAKGIYISARKTSTNVHMLWF